MGKNMRFCIISGLANAWQLPACVASSAPADTCVVDEGSMDGTSAQCGSEYCVRQACCTNTSAVYGNPASGLDCRVKVNSCTGNRRVLLDLDEDFDFDEMDELETTQRA